MLLGRRLDKMVLPGNLYGSPTPATASTLFFVDRPSLPSSILGPDDYVYFQTQLVGVRADGTIDPLDDVAGTTFQWRTNAQTDSGVFDEAIIAVIPDGTLPPVVFGGVSDAHRVVPEPCAATLLGIGGRLPAGLCTATARYHVLPCRLRGAGARCPAATKDYQQRRQDDQHQRELHDQAGDDGDGQRLLHRGSLADAQGQRQQGQDGRQRGHGDRPHAVDAGQDEPLVPRSVSPGRSWYSE